MSDAPDKPDAATTDTASRPDEVATDPTFPPTDTLLSGVRGAAREAPPEAPAIPRAADSSGLLTARYDGSAKPPPKAPEGLVEQGPAVVVAASAADADADDAPVAPTHATAPLPRVAPAQTRAAVPTLPSGDEAPASGPAGSPSLPTIVMRVPRRRPLRTVGLTLLLTLPLGLGAAVAYDKRQRGEHLEAAAAAPPPPPPRSGTTPSLAASAVPSPSVAAPLPPDASPRTEPAASAAAVSTSAPHGKPRRSSRPATSSAPAAAATSPAAPTTTATPAGAAPATSAKPDVPRTF